MSIDPIQIREIFTAALDAPNRGTYLETACGGNQELKKRVTDLLNSYDQVGDFLPDDGNLPHVEELTTQVRELLAEESSSLAAAPKSIGPFDVLEIIATGGMGTVYLARQENPSRIVAVKSLRLGLNSEETARRLRYESQILASLRHPGIAQIFEAGIHESDDSILPYFAMEYIPDARAITAYATEERLDIQQRLVLFKEACAAVAFAHAKGVIHRDLKPGNVVVDNQGRVKIIDFGVARAMDLDIANRSLATRPGDLVGTLQYMSPEQALGEIEQIDTRSDVYALGLLLFELLGQRLPYDLSGLNVLHATRMIQETPTPRLGSINRDCCGELETIIDKCVQKDPSQRYASSAALAEDIGRYLAGEAVLATPPSLPYKLRVLVRRHTTWTVATAITVIAVVVGCIGGTLLYQRAQRSKLEVSRVSSALLQMVRMVEPTAQGKRMSPDAILDYVSSEIEKGIFSDSPLLEATLRGQLGARYVQLGSTRLAESNFRRAFEIRTAHLGREHPDTLRSATSLAKALRWLNRKNELEKLATETFEIQKRILGVEHTDTLKTMDLLAVSASKEGNHDKVLDLKKHIHQTLARKLGKNNRETLWALFSLAVSYSASGQHAKAEELHREVWHARKAVYGEDHLDTLLAMRYVSWELVRQEKFAEAEPIIRENLERTRNAAGPNHERTAFCRYILGKILYGLGDLEPAKSEFRDVVNESRRQNKDNPFYVLDLAKTLRDLGEFDESEELFRSSLAVMEEERGSEDQATGMFKSEYGELLFKMGHHAEAEELLLEGYEAQKSTRGAGIREAIERLIQVYEATSRAQDVDFWKEQLRAFKENTAGQHQKHGK